MSQPTSNPSADSAAIDRLLDLMARLRAPDGCPWDRDQTPATLKPHLLEEAYEVLEAIDSGSAAHLVEELGDLLLHIIFQAQIARESGDFTFADVAQGISDKLVRRHPHVFGQEKVADAAHVVSLWHKLKQAEKPERLSALDGVPRALPALLRAEALQKKARNVGFDWPSLSGPLEKVREEIGELTHELETDLAFARANESTFQPSPATGEELGDLLFSIVNLSRHLKLNAEELLSAANDKFALRFRAVEQRIAASGKVLTDCSLEELDAAWNAIKLDSAVKSPPPA